jgi:lipopolysaccharide transport system permease protein
MRHFPMAPQALIRTLWTHRGLLRLLIKREIAFRYQGSMMGMLWLLLNPLLMLCIYTFIFRVVFKARWGDSGDSKTEFALVLFIGLLIFNLFADCIQRAPLLIINNMNYVKKVIFPLEILPWVIFCAALFHFAVGLAVWLLVFMVLHGLPAWTAWLLMVVLLPLAGFAIGSAYLLATLGVCCRDTSHIITILTTILLFLSPIFYPVSGLPERYQALVYLNPLTWVVEQARGLLLAGETPQVSAVLLATTGSLAMLWFGFSVFQRFRQVFADAL